MKICVLASGSEGNSTYIETKKHKVLIDLGKNVSYIKQKLDEIDVDIKEINAVVISHTHSDHISAISGFIKKYDAEIYVSEKMLDELQELEKHSKVRIYDEVINFDELIIQPFKSSHDVVDSRNFIITTEGKNVAYVTDTGYINKKHFEKLSNLDIYLFESNHDVEMLMNGPYPTWLKRRVVGTCGHLSNRDAAIYLAKFIGPNTQKVILTHLSKKNNKPQLAMETIKEVFAEYEINFNNIVCAEQNSKSEIIII